MGDNGHTPQEIFEKFERLNLSPLPDKPFEFGSKKDKIGRTIHAPAAAVRNIRSVV